MCKTTDIEIQLSPATWVPARTVGTFKRDGRIWFVAVTEDGTKYHCHPDKVRIA